MGAQRAGKIAGEPRAQHAHGAGRAAVHRRIDQEDGRVILEAGEEMKSPRPPVQKCHTGWNRFLFERLDGVDPHPLVPQEVVADAQNEYGGGRSHGGGNNTERRDKNKKGSRGSLFIELAGGMGFEPTTPGFGGLYSIQLS